MAGSDFSFTDTTMADESGLLGFDVVLAMSRIFAHNCSLQNALGATTRLSSVCMRIFLLLKAIFHSMTYLMQIGGL